MSYQPVSKSSSGGEGQPIFQSPEQMSQPFDSSPRGIEMQQANTARPQPPHRPSQVSFHSNGSEPTMGQSKDGSIAVETKPFLQNVPYKSNTMDSTVTTVPYKESSGRQLRHLLIGSSVRWIITVLLCAAWTLCVALWTRKGAITELNKRIFNSITTAIALALGLNIASGFKDLAFNMRWPILASRERNLVELDLILHADSLSTLAKLVFVTRRPWVIITAVIWLLVNIAAQAGIAAVGLTYGFEVDDEAVLIKNGNVTVANMDYFYPLGTFSSDGLTPTLADQGYTAHQYGGLSAFFGINATSELPKPEEKQQPSQSLIFYDNSTKYGTFLFLDSSVGSGANALSVFTERSINITYGCNSYPVTANGNGSSYTVDVADIGTIYIGQTNPESTTYFTNSTTLCADENPRCGVIEAFEASTEQAWYYKCNITLGTTQNDPQNLSFVSDDMANTAALAIVAGGYIDYSFVDKVQFSNIFPADSQWGIPLLGSTDQMGETIGAFAMSSIVGAAMYNPPKFYQGRVPAQGQHLLVSHAGTFALILVITILSQLILSIIVAFLANRVKVGPDTHLEMSMLLRPVADKLEDISAGKENKALKHARKNIQVKYEKGPNGRWVLTHNM